MPAPGAMAGRSPIVISPGRKLAGAGQPLVDRRPTRSTHVLICADFQAFPRVPGMAPTLPLQGRTDRGGSMTTPVLVVDDEPMVRKSLALALERAGASVVTAVDGQDALAKFREQKAAVIFSDVKMPGIDGFALLRSVKRL